MSSTEPTTQLPQPPEGTAHSETSDSAPDSAPRGDSNADQSNADQPTGRSPLPDGAQLAPPALLLARPDAFSVSLDNFEGPFDLLLSLIAKRQMDVTEVALSQVTDDFIAYLSASEEWDLGQATQFLVVAATLLDLKTARLLPSAEVEDEEDLALLEARDLLFARLLQYRAYKLAAAYFAELDRAQALRHPRSVELDTEFSQLLPEVEIGVSADRFAILAARAMAPRPVPVVGIDHIHSVRVSVHEHMQIIRERIRQAGSATFRALVADCGSTLEVVARFLGLLELYREGSVAFDQAAALAELRVRWVNSAAAQSDREAAAAEEPAAAPPVAADSGFVDSTMSTDDETERSVDEEYG
ncbi:condensin subunit ScpA [Jatrophihabitans sp. GAS493]|uniref:segregation and condensation protein A n=1 Tax=Jatrophihabitans sp. GAS493 TaxID=1907575 RepID=UPI000BBFF735|nr:ScpA family protein [Jatrophihabitans sp. GAS493]SOD73803.1 condensin subunit ScpA [Jatrophihabitans sp. GAS493]